MDFEKMYVLIKQLCKEKGITISQLEKELEISVGSIGKWRQYSPSIEKVIALATYFNISLDELCGISGISKEKKNKFLEHLYKRTLDKELIWIPYSICAIDKFCFEFSQNKFVEAYFSECVIKEDSANFLIGITGKKYDEIDLYLSLGKGYFKKINQGEELWRIWEEIKKQEDDYVRDIDSFIDSF